MTGQMGQLQTVNDAVALTTMRVALRRDRQMVDGTRKCLHSDVTSGTVITNILPISCDRPNRKMIKIA